MIALKTLVKEITPQGGAEPSGEGQPNEKILDEIIKIFVMMKERYPLAIKPHPEAVKEVRAFLEDIARVFDRHGVQPDSNPRI